MKKYLFLIPFLVAACGGGNAPENPSAPASGLPEYRVFTEQSYPPFIMHDGKGGVSGFEYDLLQAAAAKQGFKLTYHPYTWAGLFQTLDDGKADIVSAGITITDARKQTMSFSEPYFETESVLLAGDKAGSIKSFANLGGIKVAVKAGTSQDQMVRGGGAEPVYADTTWLTVAAVLGGKSDAAVGDLGVMSYYAKRYQEDGLRIVQDPAVAKEQLGFGVKKDNAELQGKLNAGLAQLKADGSYDKIYQKWFGEAAQ